MNDGGEQGLNERRWTWIESNVMNRYADQRILIILAGIAIIVLALSLVVGLTSSDFTVLPWLSDVLVNLGAGVVGSCVTFYLIDLRLNRQRAAVEARAREAVQLAHQERSDELRRRALVAQMRSHKIEDTRTAVEELRLCGWLDDGSMQNTDFSGADLNGLDLAGAVMPGCSFRGADLRGVDLTGADLRDCNFEMADLRGWITNHAQMDNSEFRGAKFD